MANPVEFCGVVHIKCLRGQLGAFELCQASYGWGCVSISCVLLCEASPEKIAGSVATRS